MMLNERLAVEAQRITAGLSLRQVRNRTGIDIDTLSRIKEGHVPRMDKIIQFARGFGEPVNEWLELAGYDPIEVSLEEAVRMVQAAYSDGRMSESDWDKVLDPIERKRAEDRRARGEE